MRPDGSRQVFAFADRGGFLESIDAIPEPHAFEAHVTIDGERHAVVFEEHEHAHGAAARDNNMRAAIIHVMADAAVSVMVIVGLVLARAFGWLWMDPLAGIVGALVIASWSAALIRDTGAILLDMNPDRRMADGMRRAIEGEGDRIADLHLWRLGPGHLGAIVSVVTPKRAQRGRLPRKARPFPLAVASDDRGQARGVRAGRERHRPSRSPGRRRCESTPSGRPSGVIEGRESTLSGHCRLRRKTFEPGNRPGRSRRRATLPLKENRFDVASAGFGRGAG